MIPTIQLKQIIRNIDSGSRPKGGVSTTSGDIPSLGAEHLSDDGGFDFTKLKLIPDHFYRSMTKGKILSEDILVVKDGATTGKTSFVSANFPYNSAAINEHVFRITPKKDVVYPKYLFWYLYSPYGQRGILADFRGATVGGISKRITETVQVPLPSLPEQKRIAAILDKADAIRRKRRESLQLADAFLRSVFLEMFGSAFQHNKWAIKRLSECSEVVSGVTKGRKLDPDKTVFVPYMRVANVQDSFIDLSEIKSIEVLPADVEKFRILKNDILLTEGGDPDKLGRGAVWKYDIKDCIHQNHIFRVRPDFALLESNYLSALIGSSYGKKYFLKNAKQTTGIASINSTQLKNFPVIIPPLNLQVKYAKIVGKVEKVKKKAEKATEQADELFNSLTQRAFRGEL